MESLCDQPFPQVCAESHMGTSKPGGQAVCADTGSTSHSSKHMPQQLSSQPRVAKQCQAQTTGQVHTCKASRAGFRQRTAVIHHQWWTNVQVPPWSQQLPCHKHVLVHSQVVNLAQARGQYHPMHGRVDGNARHLRKLVVSHTSTSHSEHAATAIHHTATATHRVLAAVFMCCCCQCCCDLWVVLHIEQLRQQLPRSALYAEAAHAAVACGLQVDLNNRHTPAGITHPRC